MNDSMTTTNTQHEKALAATHSLGSRMSRLVWGVVYVLFFRPSPRPLFGYRSFLLRCFGAKIGNNCHIYPKAIIWAPWNLNCGEVVAIADGAEIYNTSLVSLGELSVISQNAYICCGTHDFRQRDFPFKTKPVTVGKKAWIASRAIVLPGVSVGESAVVGAGAVVNSDVLPFQVVAGNPAKVVKTYEYIEN